VKAKEVSMRTMLDFIVCFLLLGPTLAAQASASEEEIRQWLQGTSETVDAELARFHQEGDEAGIANAYAAVFRHGRADLGPLSWEELFKPLLRLQIRVTLAAYAARDWNYDFHDYPRFSTRAAVPPGAGHFPGMDPEKIRDPEVRRVYQERIAENERRKAKFMREKELQTIIDDGIRVIRKHVHFFRHRRVDNPAEAVVKEMIKDDHLLDLVFRSEE
jgi:hypothetical protein